MDVEEGARGLFEGTLHIVTDAAVAPLIKRGFGLDPEFIRSDYKPRQITIAWNSFLNSTVCSLGPISSTAVA
jgi:hypothetical protein